VSTYDPANVLATVTSHRRGLPLCHGIRDNPSIQSIIIIVIMIITILIAIAVTAVFVIETAYRLEN